MPGINTGILTSTNLLSTERIKELKKVSTRDHNTHAYLNENSELCFSIS